MKKPQNIYDNSQFYNEYKEMRDGTINANELIEIPIMKTMLPDLKGKRILDLGCGSGGMSKYFIENGANYVLALDISQNMINEAKEKKLNEIKNAIPVKREVEQIENVEVIEKINVIDTTKIKKQIENLLNLYLYGNIPKDIYMKKYNTLQAQLEEARKEQKEIKPKQEKNIEAINQILNQPLEERYLMMDNKERRRFWRSIIESITLDKETGITFELKV